MKRRAARGRFYEWEYVAMKTLEQMASELLALAMNVSSEHAPDESYAANERSMYKIGHRDARHAIAEAIAAYFAELMKEN